jgi:hypothetical protein
MVLAVTVHSLGDRYEIDYEMLVSERKVRRFCEPQVNELKNSKAVAIMGPRPGWDSCRSVGTECAVFKRMRKDDHTPVREAPAQELATDWDPKIDAAFARPFG